MVFTYNESRGRQHIETTLKKHFQGTLITDGYAAYARFAEQTQDITHAQCSATAPALLYLLVASSSKKPGKGHSPHPCGSPFGHLRCANCSYNLSRLLYAGCHRVSKEFSSRFLSAVKYLRPFYLEFSQSF